MVGIFPAALQSGSTGQVALIGFNLNSDASVEVKAGDPGKSLVVLDPEKYRWRKNPEVTIESLPVVVEHEPNDTPATATAISVPGVASGRIWSSRGVSAPDPDFYRFRAKGGQTWVLETEAMQKGSPTDTQIEVIDSAGAPVPRILLQAVRNTGVNFRSADANAPGLRLDHYEEMGLNEYLYLNGDVMKLLRMPQGPDSEMLMYSRAGKRHT